MAFSNYFYEIKVLFDCMKSHGYVSVIFFIALLLIGNLVMLNLVLGIFIVNYEIHIQKLNIKRLKFNYIVMSFQ